MDMNDKNVLSDPPVVVQKQTLLDWKESFKVIIGLFIAGCITVIYAVNFMDSRAEKNFYNKESGAVMETKVLTIEEKMKSVETKIDNINTKQTIILQSLSRLEGKLDTIK